MKKSAAGRGGGSQVVAEFPEEFRFEFLSLEDEMQNLTAVCWDLQDTQHAFKVCL